MQVDGDDFDGGDDGHDGDQGSAAADTRGAQERTGANWFEVPDDNAHDYETKMAPVWARLGRPKDAKGYAFDDPSDFEFDDVDREYRESFRPVAHRAGLTQRQVKMLQDFQVSQVKLIRDSEKARREGASTAARSELQKEWGRSYDSNLKGANAALEAFAGKDARRLAGIVLKDGSRLGDKIEFVRMMASIAASAGKAAAGRSSPTTIGGAGADEEALDQIQEIQNSAIAQGLDPSHSRWPHKQLERLYAKAYGSEPLDTSGASPPGSRRR
jgi:hypothetical protein